MRVRTVVLMSALLVSSAALAAAVKVACIGDSITYGTGIPDRARDGYPAQLQRLLDERFPKKYEVRSFGNPGRGIYLDLGGGTRKHAFRYMSEHKEALAWRPDIVISNLGINDFWPYREEAGGTRAKGAFVRDYLALLSDYEALPSRPDFFMWTKLGPLVGAHTGARSDLPMKMRADLEEVARRVGAVALDLYTPFQPESEKYILADGVHPNEKGAALIARVTFEALVARYPTPPEPRVAASRLTLMTYNIRGGLGTDDFWDLSRPIAVVKKVRPDVLCLQEVDVSTDRSFGAHEPMMMGHILRPIWRWSFSKTMDVMNGQYGIAMLQAEEPLKTERLLYPRLGEKTEPRSLLVNEFKDYVVCSTHMSLDDAERMLGLKTIDDVLARYEKPVFVCGDWNSTPDSAFVKEMEKRFVILNDRQALTAPANRPDCLIDYIAVDRAHAAKFTVVKREVMDEPEASDHRPVYVRLEY